jgi:hypothetical protein
VVQQKAKVARPHRRRRHKNTQMLLPLRKNRRRNKGFCLGTGKLTDQEQRAAVRRLHREAERARHHLPLLDERPVIRAQCQGGARPCPWVGCRHHLYLDVNPENGSIKLNFPGATLESLKETCSLDVSDRGGATLDEVGLLINITMERVRQIEVDCLPKLKEGLQWQDSDLYT